MKYNIPVSLWLPERYPNVAPIMYVVPTPDMIIKPRHAFVDASGVVNSPYLRNWSQPHSTLMIMCNDVSIQFGQDPPLFSKPPGWVPPAPVQNQQSPQRPPQQPSRAQSPANQHAEAHHHTFQAENPMIRYCKSLKPCKSCVSVIVNVCTVKKVVLTCTHIFMPSSDQSACAYILQADPCIYLLIEVMLVTLAATLSHCMRSQLALGFIRTQPGQRLPIRSRLRFVHSCCFTAVWFQQMNHNGSGHSAAELLSHWLLCNMSHL